MYYESKLDHYSFIQDPQVEAYFQVLVGLVVLVFGVLNIVSAGRIHKFIMAESNAYGRNDLQQFDEKILAGLFSIIHSFVHVFLGYKTLKCPEGNESEISHNHNKDGV